MLDPGRMHRFMRTNTALRVTLADHIDIYMLAMARSLVQVISRLHRKITFALLFGLSFQT